MPKISFGVIPQKISSESDIVWYINKSVSDICCYSKSNISTSKKDVTWQPPYKTSGDICWNFVMCHVVLCIWATGSRGVKFVRKNYPSYILPCKIHNQVI